jgi:RNA polymerase sigma-70 factor (sigma-E family)
MAVAMAMTRAARRHGASADNAEFSRFARSFSTQLLQAAYLLLGELPLAEDAVQTTMFRVYRRWNSAHANPEAYSRQTLINVCRDHWRRQSRRVTEVAPAEFEVTDRAPAFSEALHQRDALKQALRALPDLQREVLVLRFYFDFSLAQTAEALDVAEGTVKSAAHRGLNQLRALLAPTEEVESC